MLYREIIAVCFQIHTKHINTQCGQNVELLSVKPGGTYSNHWALKGERKVLAHLLKKIRIFYIFIVCKLLLSETQI
jgi:hypothetical protein